MKLRLENGNFKVAGIPIPGPGNKLRCNKLPVGLDPIDFLGIIVEIRGPVSSLPVTYNEIVAAHYPAATEDADYDDVIALSCADLDTTSLYYNKTTGDIGTDVEEIANKSESNDTETEQNTDDPVTPGDGGDLNIS